MNAPGLEREWLAMPDIGCGDRQLLDQQGVTLQALVRDQRFDCQVQLVRDHWASVRRLWLNSAVPSGTTRIRSDLPDDFLLGCGMPGIASIKPTDDGRF